MDKGNQIQPTGSFRFTNIPDSPSGGCHALVWLPEGKDKSEEKLPVAVMIHGG
jgi:carboxylesterase type B